MKKLVLVSSLIIVVLTGCFQMSTANASTPVGLGITFVTKAYWDGQTKSCISRDKGFCFHLTIGTDRPIGGQVLGSASVVNNVLIFTFSKTTGITSDTFNALFNNGSIVLDGDGTFSSDALSQLGLSSNYYIPAGTYSYTVNGDIVTITF
jgi:hypothetical protein